MVVDTIKTDALLCAQAETQLIIFLQNISEKLWIYPLFVEESTTLRQITLLTLGLIPAYFEDRLHYSK